MTEFRGRKRKYPLGVKVKKYPVDSKLIERVGNFGTANDTLLIALQKAIAAARSGMAAGMKPTTPKVERESLSFNVTEDVADEVMELAKELTGTPMKFEKSLQIVIELAEKARQAGST